MTITTVGITNKSRDSTSTGNNSRGNNSRGRTIGLESRIVIGLELFMVIRIVSRIGIIGYHPLEYSRITASYRDLTISTMNIG